MRLAYSTIMHLHGKPKQKAPALSSEQLILMATYLAEQHTLASIRNNALLQTGFFGALRVSELTHLKIEHITFVPEGMEILIPRSKTDQHGEGQHCAIPYGDPFLCPTTAIKAWCERAHIQSGFVFCEVDRYQNIGKTPLSSKSVGSIIRVLQKNRHKAGFRETRPLFWLKNSRVSQPHYCGWLTRLLTLTPEKNHRKHFWGKIIDNGIRLSVFANNARQTAATLHQT